MDVPNDVISYGVDVLWNAVGEDATDVPNDDVISYRVDDLSRTLVLWNVVDVCDTTDEIVFKMKYLRTGCINTTRYNLFIFF